MAKAPTEIVAPTTKGLHGRLKEIVQKEIEQLPTLLEQLEPKERVRTVLALLPYVTPKIETVATDFGEPFSWGG
jgi:hypothetical protein